VSTSRTQWHVLFYAALKEHGPPSAEVLAEVPLSSEPLRADILLIRRKEATGPDPDPRTLRALWPYLVREMLIEYKSPSRPPRPYDVAKLLGYGGQLHALRGREIGPFRNLLLGMVVTSLNGALLGDLWGLGAPIVGVAPGYHMVETRPYRLLVVDLSVVVRAEKDEWMAVLVPSTLLTAEAKRWLEAHMPTKDIPMNEQLEGHNEVLERLLHSLTPEEIFQAAGTERLLASLPPEQLLAHLPPEQRLAGLPPEQRLAGLPPEQRLLAMPDSALRALPDDYLRTLPADVQVAIRRRIEAAGSR
jgi:hypothetical protein